MLLKITINQQSPGIQVNESFLTHHQVEEIQYDGKLTIQMAAQISQLLKYNGTLTGIFDDNGIILLESCGLYRVEDQKFQKKPLLTTQLFERTLTNAYGKYDYIELKFINSTNPFLTSHGQELINEDDLLNDGVQVKQVESCASKPRACANCTCGRKELEEKLDQETLIDQLKNQSIQGGCGSCYLGDAFRCANCPYRGNQINKLGLPAFKDGEQVKVLQGVAQFDEELVSDKVLVKDGKVKLQL